MNKITVKTHDSTVTASNGKLNGQVRHSFYSPTHWTEICEVVIDYNPHRPHPQASLHYGAGGCNKGFDDSQIALALSQAFAQAAVLLAQHSTQEAA